MLRECSRTQSRNSFSCGAARRIQRRGRAGRVGHLLDRLEVVPHQQHPVPRHQLLHRAQPLRRLQPREVRAEHRQAQRRDHPVQAEAGHTRLERMPHHQPRVIDPAGITPPPGEPLGQLGLPRPPRPGQHHHPLQPGRRLQLVEQVIAAHERAHRGQRVQRRLRLGGRGADLVQRRIQRRDGGRAGGAGLRGTGPPGACNAPGPASRPAACPPSGSAARRARTAACARPPPPGPRWPRRTATRRTRP